ncbi:Lipoprotein-anchoring transpeptidase ErfK/SrfK [Rhizobiales bacterium GAS191]|nr:Lipoprotein-anchoring transpeptidase ErfK/SrfK [Rhizobiales bacterium GAS113]SEC04860.1 Lipoprotein-anchoring transpeptidase ErfK/SrfK [Rhizobiales bacterium GAS188]SED17598.1 Lipoprotein-anchoring transpeptidase ErfK/SrfK [Rhizobiales bacterium GAS191]
MAAFSGLTGRRAGAAPLLQPEIGAPRPSQLVEGAAYDEASALYGPVLGEPFPVPRIDLSRINAAFLRREVSYQGNEQPGTIIIDPHTRYLHFVLDDGRAIRYGVGVGREGFGWSGKATIKTKQEWPDWYPPKEMIARQPDLRREVEELQSGLGMRGGPGNPLGARAMYLWQGNKDTLFRIHGTVEPWTIGKRVSSGCIRMINQDAIDLYGRVPLGTQVIVLGDRGDEVAARRPQVEAPVGEPLQISPDPYSQPPVDSPYSAQPRPYSQPSPYGGQPYPYANRPYPNGGQGYPYAGQPYPYGGRGYPYRGGYAYDPYGRPYVLGPGPLGGEGR